MEWREGSETRVKMTELNPAVEVIGNVIVQMEWKESKDDIIKSNREILGHVIMEMEEREEKARKGKMT